MVLGGRELGQGEVGAEGVGFEVGGDFPVMGDVGVGQGEGFEAQRFGVGQLEHAFFAAANRDDRLAGGIVDVGRVFELGGVDHAVDVFFGVGAEFEFSGETLDGGGGENFFDGAQGDVMRAGGGEGCDANFADEDVGAFGAKFEDVIDPGGAVAESGLGDDVERFEGGDGVAFGGGAGMGGERGEKRQRGDRGGRVEREAQGAGSFWTSRRHRGKYTLGAGRIEEGANG